MKINLLILILMPLISFAQLDTIFTDNQKLLVNVKEISNHEIKYTFPNEDLLNSIYKNSVEKIVFKNGRIQTFNESSSFKNIDNIEDYDKITLTQVQSEVLGLNRIGDVSSKAVGTTVVSNVEKVKDRAYKKLKIQAAMLGANIIYLSDMRSQGNKWGGYYSSGQKTETSLTGIAYSNKVLDLNEFKRNITKSEFQISEIYELKNSSFDVEKNNEIKDIFYLENIEQDGKSIYITGKIGNKGASTRFKLSRFNNTTFGLFSDGKRSVFYHVLNF